VGWLLSATPAAAATLITASGTFVRTSFVQSNIRQVDGVTLFDFTEHGVRSGTFSGTSVVQGSCVVRASGQASCQAVETFTGTVAGETGTVVLHDVVASDLATGSVHGSFTVVHGGSLTNVHGHGTFQGTGGTRTYSALLVLAP
jgi:hypothetical protein